MNASPIFERADTFCRRFSLQLPTLLAPMAGACPVPSAWMAPAQPAADVLRGMRKQAQALLR